MTSLAGAALAILIKSGKFGLVRRGLVPYGVAIGIGGLLTVPAVII